MSFRLILVFLINLLPLVGILYGGWDAFVLLVLYWLETAVLAFWAIFRVALERQDDDEPVTDAARKTASKSRKRRRRGNTIMAAFFTVHSGIFMLVHFVLLWSLFAGDWRARVTGPISFVQELVIDTGAWVPLIILFMVRGMGTLLDLWQPDLARRLGMASESETEALPGFYRRIMVMHVTILFGGGVANMIGGTNVLFGVVALKILLDTFWDFSARKPDGAPRGGARTATR